jgi:hypothetical protein
MAFIMDSDEYFRSGIIHGVIVGGLTFIGAWIYCTATYGFLFGFGLGWIASGILGALVGAILLFLWPLFDLAVSLLVIFIGFLIIHK